MILNTAQARAFYTAAIALAPLKGKAAVSFATDGFAKVTIDHDMAGLVKVSRQTANTLGVSETYTNLDGFVAAYNIIDTPQM